jgi:FixJ family two-component response regulator
LQLILVDGDVRRRALISHGLLDGGIHVEPFEDVSELIAHWPRAGLILAHDDGTGIARLIAHMSGSGGWLPLVAFAEKPSTRQVVQAMRAGVLDYLDWPCEHGGLADALAAAQENGRAMTSAKLREAIARSRIGKLSEREREVLGSVARGLSNDLIARELGISSRTVEIHRANMLSKIGANHTSEAIRIAIEAALLD